MQTETRTDISTPNRTTRRWLIGGVAQGVGLRPFVYRLAQTYQLDGWVRNQRGSVEIVASGPTSALQNFEAALFKQQPSLAKPELLETGVFTGKISAGFFIASNIETIQGHGGISSDSSICSDCLSELNNPNNRRYRYPFINCTQCGPRYSVINALPYDRHSTTLAVFEVCADCQCEYTNPAERRFHAQTISCEQCGPRLSFSAINTELITNNQLALSACTAAFKQGKIVAVKGVGGYHLMCDARNETAVLRLRQRKQRPDKPLAVLFPWRGENGLDEALKEVSIDDVIAQALTNPARPIVLADKSPDSSLASAISPNLNQVGVMLPYSPLTMLISADFDGPLVATSANISGEPAISGNEEAEKKLATIADAFLHHNQTIAHPVDDSVFTINACKARPMRLGRGSTPLELRLPFTLDKPLLALGAQLKNTIALAWDDRVVISPHIGDLGSASSMALFQQTVHHLQQLYNVNAVKLVCDAHPGFSYRDWAQHQQMECLSVFHHHAHASALAAEHNSNSPILVFTWDGMGLGDDNTLWGGEALLGTPGQWQRVASLRPWKSAGGERVAREPWRSAAGLLWSANQQWHGGGDNALLYQAWQQNINCHTTTAIGRLFDAAAAILELNSESSFEGQAPMLLEANAIGKGVPVELPIDKDNDGVFRADWRPLLAMLCDYSVEPTQRAADFHASLSHLILQQSQRIKNEHDIHQVGLSGGAFQNRRLTEQTTLLLKQNGFEVLLHQQLPCNDAGISYGQIIEAGSRQI